jgi:hypothetical protein
MQRSSSNADVGARRGVVSDLIRAVVAALAPTAWGL